LPILAAEVPDFENGRVARDGMSVTWKLKPRGGMARRPAVHREYGCVAATTPTGSAMAVGLAAMTVSVVVGTIVGVIAGIARGGIDAALMWLTDLFPSLRQLPLLLVVYLFGDALKNLAGPEVGVFILIVAVIGAFRWMPVARLVRAQFFALRGREFVEGARALGATTTRQVVHHILPNSLGPAIVAGTIGVAAIIAESTLSFLGLGFPPDIPTRGACSSTERLPRHRGSMGAVSRCSDLSRGSDHQLHRRWIARHARPAQCDLATCPC
jgi:ABC-type methionine transport system permease subunit